MDVSKCRNGTVYFRILGSKGLRMDYARAFDVVASIIPGSCLGFVLCGTL